MVRLCRCGAPVSKSGCRACDRKKAERKERKHTRRLERKAAGLCVSCPKEAVTESRCFKCWLRMKADRYLGRPGASKILLATWNKQRGRCAYTGVLLIPGPHASLDHIMPASRGGKNTAENLQWCVTSVNIAKSALNHEEFIELCRLVSRRFPKKKTP